MLYTKKIYDNKLEYPITLEHVNNGKYFFEIEDDFSEIILDQVEFLNLLKKKKRMNMNPKRKKKMKKKKKKQESKTIQYLGVIVNYTLCEKNENNKNYYIIWILPINKHITSLEGHTGKYKIKEEFCLIPYERMLNALDLFVDDCPDDEDRIFDRPVSLYLARRIVGESLSMKELKKDKNGELRRKFENHSGQKKNA